MHLAGIEQVVAVDHARAQVLTESGVLARAVGAGVVVHAAEDNGASKLACTNLIRSPALLAGH